MPRLVACPPFYHVEYRPFYGTMAPFSFCEAERKSLALVFALRDSSTVEQLAVDTTQTSLTSSYLEETRVRKRGELSGNPTVKNRGQSAAKHVWIFLNHEGSETIPFGSTPVLKSAEAPRTVISTRDR